MMYDVMTDSERADALSLSRWRADLKIAEEWIRRAEALRALISGMERLHPEWTSGEPDVHGDEVSASTPGVSRQLSADEWEAAVPVTAADVVRELLRANPDHWYTSGEMVKAVLARLPESNANAIRLALSRTDGKESVKRGDGKGQTFRFRTESELSDTLGGL